jgi:hypothetical protein
MTPVVVRGGVGSCLLNYTYYAQLPSCWRFVVPTSPLTWSNAQQLCAQDGGSLATIHTAAQNHFLTVLSNEGTWTNAWIGAKCDSGDWKWGDGSLLVDSHAKFDITTPSTGCQIGSCLVHSRGSFGSTWKMLPCGDGQTSLICQHPFPTPPPTASPPTPAITPPPTPGRTKSKSHASTAGIVAGTVLSCVGAMWVLFVCMKRRRRRQRGGGGGMVGRKLRKSTRTGRPKIQGGLGSVRLLTAGSSSGPSSPAKMELRGLGASAAIPSSPASL